MKIKYLRSDSSSGKSGAGTPPPDRRAEALVSTAWLEAVLLHDGIVIIECSEDTSLYNEGRAVTEKGTFKSTVKLREIYQENHDLTPEDDVITYCRIGERASHTWFVLTQLLGFRRVRNYDGGWSDWGHRPHSPVAVIDGEPSGASASPDTTATPFRRS